ncbi:MAG: hypothetical protein V4773_17185 [Verrucomicrobiota bacterium]
MSADNDDSEYEEKKSYNFLFRFIIFTVIAGPASVFGFGIYGRMGIQNSLTALEKGNYSPLLILVLWIVGLIGTAFMVFKK